MLVVEDDELVRELLASAFEDAGWTVEETSSCEGMTRALKRKTISVVLVDRHLPDGDGWIAASDLRQRATWTDLVVIAMTGHLALSSAERALVTGCEAFLEKPFEPRIVIEMAARLLGSRDPKTTTRRKRLRDT